MTNDETNRPAELKKDIGLVSALAIVVGMVLGAGAFMKPPAVMAAAGDSTWALAAWVIGAVFSMAGDVAPLVALAALAQEHDAWHVVDDAHGFGWVLYTSDAADDLARTAVGFYKQVTQTTPAEEGRWRDSRSY